MPTFLRYKFSCPHGEPPNLQSSSPSSAGPLLSPPLEAFSSGSMSRFPCECLQHGRSHCHEECTSSLVQYTAEPILSSLSMPLNATESSPCSNAVADDYIVRLDTLPAAPYSWYNTYRAMPWHANAMPEYQSTQTANFQPNEYTTCTIPSGLPSNMITHHEAFTLASEGFHPTETPTEGPEARESK